MEATATVEIDTDPCDGLGAGVEREGLLRALERLESAMSSLEHALWDEDDRYGEDGRAAASR
ncbi:MAG TPA: hypothetical protein VD838_10725 [Anaeromyxobacteraceae bacterium]|nr:hypothetical protein [Anaeromyxobacteraceae bacterium]